MGRVVFVLIAAIGLFAGSAQAAEIKQQEPVEVNVGEGHHFVLPVKGRVKRVAVGNSDTANVTVLKNDTCSKKALKPQIIHVK